MTAVAPAPTDVIERAPRRAVSFQRILGGIVIVALFAFGVYSLAQMDFRAEVWTRAGDNIARVFAGMHGLIGRRLCIRVGEFALRRTQPIFRRVTVREVDAER